MTSPLSEQKPLGVLDRLAIAGAGENRPGLILGACFGGFVPIMTYVLAHHEASVASWKWGLVVAGLAYSALTVYDWAKVAFGNPIKAGGFVILLEGVMTASSTVTLSLAGLAFLICVNASATAYNLIVDRTRPPRRRRSRARARAGKKSVSRTSLRPAGPPPALLPSTPV